MDNMTVLDLKRIIDKLPNDMEVIIPDTEGDVNNIVEFYHVRTAGILKDEYEDKPALCLNAATHGLDITSQMTQVDTTTCEKVLF